MTYGSHSTYVGVEKFEVVMQLCFVAGVLEDDMQEWS